MKLRPCVTENDLRVIIGRIQHDAMQSLSRSLDTVNSESLDRLRDKIQNFAPEQKYEPGDLIELSSVALQLLDELGAMSAKLTRVSNTLANHLDQARD